MGETSVGAGNSLCSDVFPNLNQRCVCVCAAPVVNVVETTALVSSPLAAWSLTVYSVVSASPSSRIHVSSASRISS